MAALVLPPNYWRARQELVRKALAVVGSCPLSFHAGWGESLSGYLAWLRKMEVRAENLLPRRPAAAR